MGSAIIAVWKRDTEQGRLQAPGKKKKKKADLKQKIQVYQFFT